MERLRYFDDDRGRTFVCGCGWSGDHDELSVEEWADVLEGSCPQCGTTLAVVSLFVALAKGPILKQHPPLVPIDDDEVD